MATEYKVREVFALNPTEGDVGIEIEMEATNRFPVDPGVTLDGRWRPESDGSLRGHSIEYVLTQPIKIDEVADALGCLKANLAKHKTKPVYSFRAGVHVHVNVQEFTIPQIANFAALYYCLETPLVRFCGGSREGNHFCLRVEDAEYSMYLLERAVRERDLSIISTDNIRYASLNLRAMARYGSLEFRAMETQPDLSKIEEWCNILHKLKEAALTITDRRSIASDISFKGPETWASELLGPELFSLIKHDHFDKDVIRCLRMCQPIIYMR